MNEITRLLSSLGHGDPQANERLLTLVYDELRRVAAQKLGREMPGNTLQPTALVHEAYLRLFGDGNDDGPRLQENRGHFFAAAAEAMRRILVENARLKRARKRGGDRSRADVDFDRLAGPELGKDLLDVDEALDRLAAVDAEAVRLVKLRYFAGLTLVEAAKVMAISPRTADRLWAYGRAWLHQALVGN